MTDRHISQRQRGFTLIEVLVALAILGFVAGAILTLIGQNTRFIADQEDRMLAGMLVDCVMIERLAQDNALERGEAAEERTFANRAWSVKTLIIETGAPRVVRIEASVARAASPQILARATTLKEETP